MTDELNDFQPAPSKSRLKREAAAATKLGEQLVALDDKQLRQLKLTDTILDAVVAARKIKQHGARKRQLLFLGKLLRQIDSSEITAQLASLRALSKQENRAFHQLEQWRDKLLADDHALTALVNEYPTIDRQHLRQLIRTARREQQLNKPPSTARSLFRYLRSIMLTEP